MGLPIAVDQAGQPILDKDGKPRYIPSYSLLQDRFFEHMRQAGYTDLERGVRGSTTEHLSVLAYKVQQDKQQLALLAEDISAQKSQLHQAAQTLQTAKPIQTESNEIAKIGKRKRLSSRIELTTEEYQRLQSLAQEALASRLAISQLKTQVNDITQWYRQTQADYDKLKKNTFGYLQALRVAPDRTKALLANACKEAKAAPRQKNSGYPRPEHSRGSR